jgi:hypothetical protein
MTLIGKLLAYLNLLAGLGILAWSTTLYTQRPGWFNPIPDSISPGQNPESFKQMQAEIDLLFRTATAARTNWGSQSKTLEGLEAKRTDRLKKYDERLNWARNGNPGNDGNGFYEPVYDKSTGLLDLGTVGAPIKGADNKPLKGAEKLMANFNTDVDEVARLSEQIKTQRNEFARISTDILRNEERLRKISDIREAVQAELFFLESFEENVYQTRATVFSRKKQLVGRLNELKNP